MTVDLKAAWEEFTLLKTKEETRNQEYYLLRQAVKGNYRWPRDWPRRIPKVVDNICKPITERYVHYLLGKGFSYNLDRPNNLEYRQQAERAEKILKRLFELSRSDLQFDMGAKTGSQLGRTVFKVYKKGVKGAEHACFTHCQPDYFYGIQSSDDAVGSYSTIYYSYPVDKFEAIRLFGSGDYKTEGEAAREQYYNPRPEDARYELATRNRKVPVLEIWTRDSYALVVGGVEKYNGENPFKWSDTGEGFLPFVVIENIRNSADNKGEADIGQSRILNEQLNYLMSRKAYVVQRWLNPTVVWEGAPQNYAELLSSTLGGGGALPARLGSKLSFLAYDQANPAVLEMEQAYRTAILETAGMSDLALQGTSNASVITGAGLGVQMTPAVAGVDKKRKEWTDGIKQLAAMLLQIQEDIGDSKALGQAVVNQTVKSEMAPDGEVVTLSGKDINGLRTITVNWPGILPKDDVDMARLEMEKCAQGLQSVYTTLEKLGEEYPDDEIARIRLENQDPHLKGQEVAEQLRAQTPLIKEQMQQDFQREQQVMDPASPAAPAPEEDETANMPPEQAAMMARLRQLQAGGPAMTTGDDDETVIESAPPPLAGAVY